MRESNIYNGQGEEIDELDACAVPFEGCFLIDDLQEGAEGAQSHAALVLVLVGAYTERGAKDVGRERRLGVARGVVAKRFNFGPHVLELLLIQTNTTLLCACIGREQQLAFHHEVYDQSLMETS